VRARGEDARVGRRILTTFLIALPAPVIRTFVVEAWRPRPRSRPSGSRRTRRWAAFWPYLGALMVTLVIVAAVPWLSIGFL